MYLAKTLTATGITLAGLFAGSLLLAAQADAHTEASGSDQMMQGRMMGNGVNLPQAGNHQGMMPHGMGQMMNHEEMMGQMQAMMTHCNRMMAQTRQAQPDDKQQ